jgi:hypothetical protein
MAPVWSSWLLIRSLRIGIMVVSPPLIARPTKKAQLTEINTIRRYG